jgi:hypothetical protein
MDTGITRVTFRINPEDSKGVGVVKFYDNLAVIWGRDPEVTHYDCTKIHVARNIQSNIFEVLGAQSSDPCYTGMVWALHGPKTFDELPDDTVELLDGFFRTPDEAPLPFGMAIISGLRNELPMAV